MLCERTLLPFSFFFFHQAAESTSIPRFPRTSRFELEMQPLGQVTLVMPFPPSDGLRIWPFETLGSSRFFREATNPSQRGRPRCASSSLLFFFFETLLQACPLRFLVGTASLLLNHPTFFSFLRCTDRNRDDLGNWPPPSFFLLP